MSIVKSKHASNYTVLPNDIFTSGLSIQAIGLLAYFLSLPHDWVIYKTTLHTQLDMGRDKVDKTFKELQNKGYLLSVKEYDKNGKFTYNHIIYDRPYNGEPSTNLPHTEKPHTDLPLTAEQQLLSTNIQSTKEQNIYIVEKVLECLNKEVNARFSSKTPATGKLINARIKEGYTLENFETVIKSKSKEWLRDPIMKAYLRPITLFGNKFESYLNASIISTPQKPKKEPTGEGTSW